MKLNYKKHCVKSQLLTKQQKERHIPIFIDFHEHASLTQFTKIGDYKKR